MNLQLPSTSTLITESFALYKAKWNEIMKVSVWYLLIGTGLFFAYFLVNILHLELQSDLIISIAEMIAGIFSVWITIRLFMFLLNLIDHNQDKEPAEASKKAWSFFIPLILTGVLQGLFVALATLLLIIPGIYLAICYQFSSYIVIDQKLSYLQALKASKQLVTGYWWAVFGRLLLAGFLVALAVGLVIIVASLGLSVVFPHLDEIITNDTVRNNPIFEGIATFFHYVFQALFMPVFSLFFIKLYRALQLAKK